MVVVIKRENNSTSLNESISIQKKILPKNFSCR
jgi:hypothetical protein